MTDEQTCMDAYKAGFNEGQKHLAPSPQTLRIIEDLKIIIDELKKEWLQLKSRALNILLVSLVVTVGYGVWVGTIQNRLDNGEEKHVELTNAITSIDTRQHASDIASTEVRTKLANIEATLVEIKNSLKK